MKVTDPNLSSLGAAVGAANEASRSQETEKTSPAVRPAGTSPAPVTGDDVHLSELVRSLRSLAADSPDRQARLEQITRSYAAGTYQIDTHATAKKIIDDALET
jgi:flagellar biosynthesis anti-sigma factor FlgM